MPKVPFWVFVVLAALYFSAVRVDVMDIDASQYASMSMEMMWRGDYLHVYDKGVDYLDKPPFLFWASALSMKAFGINNLGYKFPSILFAIWALFATYRLTRLLYDERTGRMAALILGCCQGMFLMTNDIRTDTILMSWTITAIWLIKEWDVSRRLHHLLLGCAAIAFGMMTKGPIALLVPIFCFTSDWALKRDWRKFFRPAYLLGIVVIGILLIPMSVGLYQQFDMHPEKVIDGQTGTSGLRFFFWTQSFGRITGENTWDNNAPFSFLFENMLWAFLPWILLFVAAFIINIVILFRQRLHLTKRQEWISTGGFLLAYLALGSSQYQLPHYIFIVFPHAAIIVAALLKDFYEGKYKGLYKVMVPVQTVVSLLLLLAALMTFVYIFATGIWTYVVWICGVLFWIYLVWKGAKGRILYGSAAAIIIANIFMTHHFYYTLLQYQAGSKLGRFIHQHDIPGSAIEAYRIEDALTALSVYSQHMIKVLPDSSLSRSAGYLITGVDGLRDVQKKGLDYEIVDTGSFFKVSELTPDFINPDTRAKAVKPYYFLRIK